MLPVFVYDGAVIAIALDVRNVVCGEIVSTIIKQQAEFTLPICKGFHGVHCLLVFLLYVMVRWLVRSNDQ